MEKVGVRLIQRKKQVWSVAGFLLALYLALVTFGLGGDPRISGNVAQLIAAFFGATLCLATAGAHSNRLRRAWRLLGASAASWGTGQLIWTYYETIGGQNAPFPSLADAGYLLAVPLAIAALMTFIDTPSGKIAWARATVEGGLIASGLLYLGWALVLGPVYRQGSDSVVGMVVSLAYPVSDVITSSLVIYTATRARHETRQTMVMVGVALVCLALADSTFTLLTVRETYETGALSDLGWFCGFLLYGCAAVRSPGSEHYRGRADVGTLARIAGFLPYIPAAFALFFTIIGTIDARQDSMLWWLGLAVIVLIGALQLTTLADNARLTAHLEHRVAERTQHLESRERFFRSIVQNSTDVVSVVDQELTIAYQTPSSLSILGHESNDLVGSNLLDLFNKHNGELVRALVTKAMQEPSVEQRCELIVPIGNHSQQVLELVVANLLENQDVEGIVVTTTDITAQKVLEEQLTRQAFHDSLTLLPNRALFHDRLSHSLARSQRAPDSFVAVLYIDLDSFKSVNDSLGHAAGDQLLFGFATRVHQTLRPSDTFGRLGGDEFAVLIEPVDDVEEAINVAERILACLMTPFHLASHEIFVNTSIGIATNEFASTTEEVQRNADVAMYHAKAAGRGGYRIYEPHMHDEAVRRLETETGLRRAVENNEFVLFYQPLVDMQTGRTVNVEALIRWKEPRRGLIAPDLFIPIAEQTGLILPIGRWALRQACLDAARWCVELGAAAPAVSVNLSYRQLQHPDLIKDVAEALFDTQLPPSKLTIELTESMLADDPKQAAETLRNIKELGIRLAIDDFGTGYSSLSYLREFPFDELKIDRKFVSSLSSANADSSLVQAILDLGKLFSLTTVAEGIETDEQRVILRELGCELGQGFLFARPLPVEQLVHYLVGTNFS